MTRCYVCDNRSEFCPCGQPVKPMRCHTCFHLTRFCACFQHLIAAEYGVDPGPQAMPADAQFARLYDAIFHGEQPLRRSPQPRQARFWPKWEN